MDPILDVRGVAWQFIFRVRRMQEAHYRASRHYANCRFWLGVSVILLGASSGTSAFVGIGHSDALWIKVLGGILGILSAAAAGLQTFLKYPELSETHRVSGARFANLKHKLELLGAKQLQSQEQLVGELAKLESQWDKIRASSPPVPDAIWRRVETDMTTAKFEHDYASAHMLAHQPPWPNNLPQQTAHANCGSNRSTAHPA